MISYALGVLATTAVVAVAAPQLVALIGFTSVGPAAGSLAAAWQSSIGNVVAGSLFANSRRSPCWPLSCRWTGLGVVLFAPVSAPVHTALLGFEV